MILKRKEKKNISRYSCQNVNGNISNDLSLSPKKLHRRHKLNMEVRAIA